MGFNLESRRFSERIQATKNISRKGLIDSKTNLTYQNGSDSTKNLSTAQLEVEDLIL